ncbi:phenylalanine--tRNA ligase subunit alpha [Candidatus Woesebacteria bacterium]|nr:phenylalanine--tRNA ligase subunit alpha [Candidatus Woesebacteria bacterium]
MKEEIINLKNQALAQITEIDNLEDLKDLQITYLGRNGRLSKLIKKIKAVNGGDKKEIGIPINQTKKTLLELIASQKQKIKSKSNTEFDETVPGILPPVGNLHLVTKAIEEIAKTFKAIGFSQARYNEVEWDYFGFESLNFTKDHPARDDWETFFVDVPEDKKLGPMILTPHTSSGQVREMKRVGTPPIRMVNIAKCYRRQADVSHVPMFHQFEGLVVDKNISIVNLKGTLDYFAQNFFGESRKTRLRPYHFPFTEPSFEVDISCDVCEGSGCKLCKGGWLELGGAGMVHPNVLRNGGIDPKIYSGFAFGWGVERTYMMKEGLKIPDIRLLYSSNLQILKQF